jgi:flavin-dependent dehydrogenase
MSGGMYDVAIIGGGPAGSNAATLLAKTGQQVIVFEREKFPRFHIGKSLVSFSMKAFAPRLSLVPKKDQAPISAKTAGVMS